jgi:hypothetical protein
MSEKFTTPSGHHRVVGVAITALVVFGLLFVLRTIGASSSIQNLIFALLLGAAAIPLLYQVVRVTRLYFSVPRDERMYRKVHQYDTDLDRLTERMANEAFLKLQADAAKGDKIAIEALQKNGF